MDDELTSRPQPRVSFWSTPSSLSRSSSDVPAMFEGVGCVEASERYIEGEGWRLGDARASKLG
jgi:hypothetical protein